MPLTRDRIIGHDNERFAFRFTMLNDGVTVECQISDAAMDELGGAKGTESMARQAQFLALRDAVERIASDVFDKGPCFKGQIVRVFTKHIQQASRSRRDSISTGAESNSDQAASLRIIAESKPVSPAP
jgi:Protein of unknown function (DUF1488)